MASLLAFELESDGDQAKGFVRLSIPPDDVFEEGRGRARVGLAANDSCLKIIRNETDDLDRDLILVIRKIEGRVAQDKAAPGVRHGPELSLPGVVEADRPALGQVPRAVTGNESLARFEVLADLQDALFAFERQHAAADLGAPQESQGDGCAQTCSGAGRIPAA